MKASKTLLLGTSGLVGQAFQQTLEERSQDLLLTPSHTELDLTEQAAVTEYVERFRPEQVILAAARVGGIQANSQLPAEFIYENLMMEANVIHQSWQQGVQDLLYFGSTCMYPRLCAQPMREEELLTGPLEPTNEPYAMAKLAGWKLCEGYNRQYGTRYRTVLPTNLYGPHDNFHPEHSHVIPALLKRFHLAKLEGQPVVTIWGSGQAQREFLFVDDLVEACLFLEDFPDVLGPINIGSSQEVSIRELAETVCEVVGYSGELNFDRSKPDGMPLKKVDYSKVDQLGWRPNTSLRDGLEKTYAWYLQELQLPSSERRLRC